MNGEQTTTLISYGSCEPGWGELIPPSREVKKVYDHLAYVETLRGDTADTCRIEPPPAPAGATDGKGTNVAVASCCLAIGGAERQSVRLAVGLKQSGFDVRFINCAESAGVHAPYARELREAGIELISFPNLSSVEAWPLDGVQATVWWGGALRALLRRGDRIPGSVYVAHSSGNWPLTDEELEQANFLRVIGVSEQVSHMAVAKVGAAKAHTVWNGIEPIDRISQGARRRGEQSSFIVGVIGRYSEEKNPLGAIEALQYLPENVRLRFYGTGNLKATMLEAAENLGVANRVDVGGVLTDREQLYAELDCLLIPSVYEGHPVVSVEAMFAGVPVVTGPHGDLPLICEDGKRGIIVGTTGQSMAAGIMRLVESPMLARSISDNARAFAEEHLTAECMVNSYAALIYEALDLRQEDKSEEITAFVISCGEPSTTDCIARLKAQTYLPKIDVIKDVTPMWRAFNEMHVRCKTPYFVQVDADMLLEREAVERLYDGITTRGDKCAMFCGWLWGDAEERPITGVKIYRHEVVSRYPYVDSISCEQPQFEAMRADGFDVAIDHLAGKEECYGLHFSLQTHEMAFKRWRRLMQKWRARPEHMGWLTHMPRILQERATKNPTPINLAVYAGVIAGISGPLPPDHELDMSKSDPDARRLHWLLSLASAGPQELALYLTSKCNHACVWCRKQQTPEDAAPDMTPDVLERALTVFPSIHSVCLAGFGEPLLCDNLDGIFEVINRHHLSANIITNGVLLSKRLDDLARWQPEKIFVSLNATSAEKHRAIVGADTWETVLDGIAAARSAGHVIALSMVCTNQNIDEVPAFLRLAKHLQAKHVHLHNLLPHGSADDADFLSSVITVNSTNALAKIEEYKSCYGAELVGTWPVPIDLDAANCPRRCASPFVFMGLDGAGNTTACRRVLSPNNQFGGLHCATWIGPGFGRLRQELLGDFPLSPACEKCFGNWSE